MSVDNTWPDKCEYSISIPAKAVVFGTHIPIVISINSLLKGLSIGKVTCTLREFLTLSVPEKQTKRQEIRNIKTTVFENGEFMDLDGTERWNLNGCMDLPRSLAKCVQDCEASLIKIRHKIRISVQLLNPDGHTSELRASLPVQLFISPNHLMDDDNEIHLPLPEDARLIRDITAIPPRYDQHVYDRLWDDIPHDHYSTPLQSGANTPGVLSRNTSAENLSSLSQRTPTALSPPDYDYLRTISSSRSGDGSSTTSGSSVMSPGETSSEDLQTTLAAASVGGVAPYATSHRSAGTRSAESSRPNSAHGSSHSSQHPLPNSVYRNINELSRVPSYRTALRAGPKSLAADSIALPLYDEDGQQRSRRSSSSSPPSSRAPSPHRNRIQRLGFAIRSGHAGEIHDGSLATGTLSDAERRLRLMQGRD